MISDRELEKRSGSRGPLREWHWACLSLFLLMTLFIVWGGAKLAYNHRRRLIVETLRKGSAGVFYHYQILPGVGYDAHAEPPGPAWARWLLGEDFFAGEPFVLTHTEAY